ncbi:energy-dependent translational throttle protein EttA [Bacteriovorax stolpii]|uniref:Energy-dependent translational throttle protein EttA n=1 Tax=Bacteriovorax stolpii TaxID=960 RepID=A0A2K9NQN4_BACTC|nr:energy-dependent translational throttle protein EttA [Bacteriovorax stolpii]AUN97813.1 energy-dependent translational throttle protein EttA [Bacteriovorax stolpii]TDP51639.1 ATP-binding cassette ChvD family protein [Bacteriovorax stolpii]
MSYVNDKQIIYSMNKVGKVYKQKHVLKDIRLSYYYGAKIGVLGLNGAGKSTLLKIMAGLDTDHLGETTLAKGYTVGYLEQDPKLDPDKTVREVVQEGAQYVVDLLREFDEVNAKFGEEMSDAEMDKLYAKQADLQDKLDAANAWDLDSRLDLAMDSLNCPPADQKCGVLSGGEKRRVALCKLLLQEPDILLLDEPTNHLDAETVWWLERHLQNYKGTIIAVTHDRYFLDNVAGWILELDRGQGIPYEGNYSGWLEQKAKRLAQEEKSESKRQKSLKEELEWIRAAPKARQAKSKARIAEYEKRQQVQSEARNETNELFIPPGPRLGQKVVQFNDVAKAYGDRLLYEHLNFELPPGGIVGVIGPNGAGKTTLFRMITGKEQPTKGTISIGDSVKLAYVDQDRTLDPEMTVMQAISGGLDLLKLGGREVNARAYISRFNFSGEDQGKRIKELSGGEKNRVHLAAMLKEEGNVLLLDEPTNDLDVNTLRALEEALMEYAGCAVVISHDRFFLDRIATHMIAFEGDQVVFFDGNFSDYEEDKKKRLGDKALIPSKTSYKKLTRD